MDLSHPSHSVIVDRLNNFGFSIHHKRAIADHGLMQGDAGNKKQIERLIGIIRISDR
jgi:hypothetical protein